MCDVFHSLQHLFSALLQFSNWFKLSIRLSLRCQYNLCFFPCKDLNQCCCLINTFKATASTLFDYRAQDACHLCAVFNACCREWKCQTKVSIPSELCVFMRPLEISHGYALFLQFYMWKLSKTSSERREKGRFNKSYCVLAFSYT